MPKTPQNKPESETTDDAEEGRGQQTSRILRLYGWSRDLKTGCWTLTRYDVPESAAVVAVIDEPRHMIGTLREVERETVVIDEGREPMR